MATNVTPAHRSNSKFHDRKRRCFRLWCSQSDGPCGSDADRGADGTHGAGKKTLGQDRDSHLGRQLLDMTRIGLLYGLLLEGFKLL